MSISFALSFHEQFFIAFFLVGYVIGITVLQRLRCEVFGVCDKSTSHCDNSKPLVQNFVVSMIKG